MNRFLLNSRLTQANKIRQYFQSPPHIKPDITHVIFDLDGTLVDSEERYFELQKHCLRKYGKEFGIDQKRAVLGVTTEVEIRTIIDHYNLHNVVTPNAYRALYESLYEKFLVDCPDLPGAIKLVNHFYQSRVPMAICTNSTQFQFDIKTKRHLEWLKMIPLNVIAGSDPEIKHPKPSPEPYFVTMERFLPKPKSPKNVLIFEDSLTGAISAVESGANVVMIPQRHFDTDETHKKILKLRPRLASILNSLTEFEPETFHLPPYN